MAGPIHPPSRRSSLRFVDQTSNNMDWTDSTTPAEYSNIDSPRHIKYNSGRFLKTPDIGSTARHMGIRRFDGAARSSREWDGLRRDSELWFPDGNCLVHLYGRGQSKRGPAFRVPMEALLTNSCRPLLDRFLSQDLAESPVSEISSSEDGGYFSQINSGRFELYIPAPPTAERGQAFLYHSATRNFFAWIFGRSLIGSHLGGALVGLLNSMNEFRSVGEDNIQALMDYMDEEGYADLRNSPDHALGMLFFAEHFQFKDMWVDAFAHCTGMHDRLASSPGFEFMSRTSRALITRSRLELGARLEHAGAMLGSFLSDDLSDAHLGLSEGARSHLDKFRSFLHSYYVAKLGYYPPTAVDGTSTAFPKSIYGQMCQEFQKLYNYLVDSDFSLADTSPPSQQGGICVLQSVQAFDSRHKYPSLPHPLPLLPEGEDALPAKPLMNKRLSWHPRSDKMKPDPRLVTFSSLSKATNRSDQSLLDCSLVRAYRGFEKDCIFSPTKGDKSDKISHTDARKVRWILIYSVLQTLLSVTSVPEEVRDIQNVPYHLSVLTAGCPPWKEGLPYSSLIRTQTDQVKEDFLASQTGLPTAENTPSYSPEIKPDVDYFALTHRPQQPQPQRSQSRGMYTLGSIGGSISRKGTVRKALSTLGNMPELRHPSPKRPVYHEILVHGYGNGTNTVSITAGTSSPTAEQNENQARKGSSDSATSSAENISSRWSNSSAAEGGDESPRTSLSNSCRRGSGADSIEEFLDSPTSATGLGRTGGSNYSESLYEDSMQPDPLKVKKEPADGFMKVTTEVKVEWEDRVNGGSNDELLAYLNA